MRRVPPTPVVAWRPAGSGGGRRVLVELLAAAVAVVLTVAIVVSQLRAAPESRAADEGRRQGAAEGVAAPTTAAGPPPTAAPPRAAAGTLLDDPSFEGGLGRWRAAGGTRLERVAGARSGAWAASLTADGQSGPAMTGEAGRCQARRQYAVTVWLRASHPGTLVRVDLAEESGGRRFAVDTAGAVLDGQDWRPLEVRHVTHRPGAALAIEIAAVELPDGGQVLVDDLSLRESAGPARP